MPTYYEIQDRKFETWHAALNRIANRELGLDLDDLPDVPARDYFNSGETPAEAFEAFLLDYWEDFAPMSGETEIPELSDTPTQDFKP